MLFTPSPLWSDEAAVSDSDSVVTPCARQDRGRDDSIGFSSVAVDFLLEEMRPGDPPVAAALSGNAPVAFGVGIVVRRLPESSFACIDISSNVVGGCETNTNYPVTSGIAGTQEN